MSLRETESREEGRCKFCGGKLSLVKRMRKEEFCSPEHRDDFFLLNGDVAMERLTQSSGRSEPWTPKPRQGGPAQEGPAQPAALAGTAKSAPVKGNSPKAQQAAPERASPAAASQKRAGPAGKGAKSLPPAKAADPALARLMESAQASTSKPSLLDAARAVSGGRTVATPPEVLVDVPAEEPVQETAPPVDAVPVPVRRAPQAPPQAGLAARPKAAPAASAGNQSAKSSGLAQPEPVAPAPPAPNVQNVHPTPAAVSTQAAVPPPSQAEGDDEEIEIIVESRKTSSRPPGTFVLNGWYAVGPLTPRSAQEPGEDENLLPAPGFPSLALDTSDLAGLKMNGEMAGLVDQARAISGDLMTILVVRAAPIVFHVRPAKPAGPAAEPEDWDAFRAYAERRAREEQGPEEAYFVPYTGVAARDMVTAPVSALFGGDRVWPDWRSFIKRPRIELARRMAEEAVEPALARPTTVMLVSATVESARRRIITALSPGETMPAAGLAESRIAPPLPVPIPPVAAAFQSTFANRAQSGARAAGPEASPKSPASAAAKGSAGSFIGEPAQAGTIPSAQAATGSTGLVNVAVGPSFGGSTAGVPSSQSSGPAMSRPSNFGFARRAEQRPEESGAQIGQSAPAASGNAPAGYHASPIGPAGSGAIVALALRRQPPAASHVELPVDSLPPRDVFFRVPPAEVFPSPGRTVFLASPDLNGHRTLASPSAGRQPGRANHVPLGRVEAMDRPAAPAPAPAIVWEALAGPRPQPSRRPHSPPEATLILQRLAGLQAMLRDAPAVLRPRAGEETAYESVPVAVSTGSTTLRPRRAQVPATAISLRIPGEDRPAERLVTPYSVEFAATADQWSVLT